MVKRLDHHNDEIATIIQLAFRDSYEVEAALLGAIDFPPLKRTLQNFVTSTNEFFGIWEENVLTAAIELKIEIEYIHIQSLIVHPSFFRKGLASKVLQFVIDRYETKMFVVETGADNEPAKRLYEKIGFQEVLQWDTDHGIRKAKFEKRYV